MHSKQVQYLQFDIIVEEQWSEILIAFLAEIYFDSFQETSNGFIAYLAEVYWNDSLLQELDALKDQYHFTYTKHKLETKNWNTLWESNFEPIRIGDFCGIRADFHPPFEIVQHELIINPKMAFGTGHHETTYMMIQLMQHIDFKEKRVFDYGCGTGILAILAAKLGADFVTGIDIEQAAFENSLENAVLNNTKGIEFKEATLEKFTEKDFEIILANINRNVILNSLPTLYSILRKSGELLVSGILIADRSSVIDLALQSGFRLTQQLEQGEWCCFQFQK